MEIGVGSIGVAFIAGILTTLSPCVLPLLPLVAGSAVSACSGGLYALAGGLVFSFVAVGLFIATVGLSFGIDDGVFRTISAILLGAFGVVLLSAALQRRFAVASGRLAQLGHWTTARFRHAGLAGQFGLGAMLGAVWSPCVGPTLGAATLLATQGKNLFYVAVVMACFGVGSALPLLLAGKLSREVMQRWRGHMAGAGRGGKLLLGGGATLVSVIILTGLDRSIEAALVAASPEWLVDLTTRF